MCGYSRRTPQSECGSGTNSAATALSPALRWTVGPCRRGATRASGGPVRPHPIPPQRTNHRCGLLSRQLRRETAVDHSIQRFVGIDGDARHSHVGPRGTHPPGRWPATRATAMHTAANTLPTYSHRQRVSFIAPTRSVDALVQQYHRFARSDSVQFGSAALRNLGIQRHGIGRTRSRVGHSMEQYHDVGGRLRRAV